MMRWNRKGWMVALLLFLLVFPKGGIKIGSIPLTWGYVLLGLTAAALTLHKQWRISTAHMRIFLAQIPFQLVTLLTFYLRGIEDVGAALALITHFFLLPIFFFILFSHAIQTIDLEFFISIFKQGMTFVSCFGIFLFLFKMIVGKFLFIPLLTANLHDFDVIEFTKCITRGGIFKLISTYNNGNIYGISLLTLLPLYQHVEMSRWKRGVVKISLILTLSRTVWVGLLIEELLREFYVKDRGSHKGVLQWIMGLSLIGSILYYLNYNLGFILDPSLGGRATQFSVLSTITWIGQEPFQEFAEIVYLSVLKNFGIVGIGAFLLAMTAPIYNYIFFTHTTTSPWQRSLLSGLLTYLLVACADGAILYIPVMTFYWFCASLLYTPRKWCQATVSSIPLATVL